MRSKKTVTVAAAALAAATTLQQCPSAYGFQSTNQYQHVPSHAHRISTPLHVVSDPPSISDVTSSAADEDVVRRRSPLSMTVDELAVALGGRGRALAAWDMYRIGVDPLTYYDATKENIDVDAAVYQVVAEGAGPQLSELMSMENDDKESTSTKLENIVSLLPAKRRTEGLGKGALELLADLHTKAASPSIAATGGIEETIGRLSHISTSNDGTTKLLIRMASDGLEVETVIIPWYDREKPRSTLCVSSQVGCAQGCTVSSCTFACLLCFYYSSPYAHLLHLMISSLFDTVLRHWPHGPIAKPHQRRDFGAGLVCSQGLSCFGYSLGGQHRFHGHGRAS